MDKTRTSRQSQCPYSTERTMQSDELNNMQDIIFSYSWLSCFLSSSLQGVLTGSVCVCVTCRREQSCSEIAWRCCWEAKAGRTRTVVSATICHNLLYPIILCCVQKLYYLSDCTSTIKSEAPCTYITCVSLFIIKQGHKVLNSFSEIWSFLAVMVLYCRHTQCRHV